MKRCETGKISRRKKKGGESIVINKKKVKFVNQCKRRGAHASSKGADNRAAST